MNITQRLKDVIAFSGLSLRAFAIKCCISQTTLDKQVKGLRAVSLETISSILYAFPEISAEWFLRGEGEMLKSNNTDKSTDKVLKLADTIATLQDTINAKTDTIATLNERIKQLESKLNTK